MKLLALLVVLALRRVELQRDPAALAGTLRRLLLAPLPLASVLARTPTGRLLALVMFWVLAGFLVRFGLNDALLSLPLLATYVLLLWILLGRDRLGPDINEYLRLWYLRDGPALAAFAHARFAVDAGDDEAALHRGVLKAMFVRAFRENFVWLIVFAVTGLPGLLLLATLDAAQSGLGGSRDSLLAREAEDMRARLDWLVARLFALTLLLTGNSTRAWPHLDNRLLDDEDPAEELVATVCVAAAGVAPQTAPEPEVGLDITDARGLLLRTQVVWILLMAISVIVGF